MTENADSRMTDPIADVLAKSRSAEAALAEIIQIIGRSSGDLDAILEAILHRALDLCDAQLGILYLYDPGEGFHAAHMQGVPRAFAEYLTAKGAIRPDPATGLGRVETRREPVSIADVKAEDVYAAGEELRRATVELGGARSFLSVPMLRGEHLVGAFNIYRQEVRPFEDKHVSLVRRFADHSVVAIENARLIHEARTLSDELASLNASLERQVADQVEELRRFASLRRFLPAHVAEVVLGAENEGLLESHRGKIAALFCDLRGFTAFSETAEPEEVMEVLEAYHGQAGAIVDRHQGTITHRAGDGLMVVLNDPLPVEAPAEKAVALALELRAALGRACEGWRALGHDLGVGMGLSLGYATLGLIGSESRYDYTAVGTVVNVAARLCDEAADGQILATQRLVAECADPPPLTDLGERRFPGVARPIKVFALGAPAAAS